MQLQWSAFVPVLRYGVDMRLQCSDVVPTCSSKAALWCRYTVPIERFMQICSSHAALLCWYCAEFFFSLLRLLRVCSLQKWSSLAFVMFNAFCMPRTMLNWFRCRVSAVVIFEQVAICHKGRADKDSEHFVFGLCRTLWGTRMIVFICVISSSCRKPLLTFASTLLQCLRGLLSVWVYANSQLVRRWLRCSVCQRLCSMRFQTASSWELGRRSCRRHLSWSVCARGVLTTWCKSLETKTKGSQESVGNQNQREPRECAAESCSEVCCNGKPRLG